MYDGSRRRGGSSRSHLGRNLALGAAVFAVVVGTLVVRELVGSIHIWNPMRDVCEQSGVHLVATVRTADVAAVRAELDGGADPNEADSGGNTALGCAVPVGKQPVVALLLERGADPNKPSGEGTHRELPLGLALKGYDDAIALRLIDHGADPNATLHGRGFPLTRALAAKKVEVVAALLAHGANPSGGTDPVRPGFCAVPVDPADSGKTESESTEECSTPPPVPLQAAPDAATTADLLDRGADPNGRDGRRPLYDAVARGDDASAGLLLDRGADPLAQVYWGTTRSVRDAGLLAAASSRTEVVPAHGSPVIVDRLLQLGANPNVTSYRAPLSRALLRRDSPMVARLLDGGADPNVSGIDAFDLCALVGGGPDALRPYFIKGAGGSGSRSASGPSGSGPSGSILLPTTTIDPAAPLPEGPQPCAEGMGSDGSGPTAPYTFAPAAPGLPSDYVDPSAERSLDLPPLLIATLAGDADLRQQVVAHGADLDHVGFGGLTALAVAAARCDAAAVQTLVILGATGAAAPSGARPADLACDAVVPLLPR